LSLFRVFLALSLFTTAAACGDDDTQDTPDTPGTDTSGDGDGDTTGDGDGDGDGDVTPPAYSFDSAFVDGESSVSYSGQTFRQMLIFELNAFINSRTDLIDGAGYVPADLNAALADLNFYYLFDSTTGGALALTMTTTPGLLQMTYDDISSDKDLRGKIAGQDTVTDHKDWSAEFVGWDEGDVGSPDELVSYWFGVLGQQIVDRAGGTIPNGPDGAQIGEVYVTPAGQDLKQLTQKFLLGAVAFSQGTDDYLDDDVDGKGLLSSNLQDGDKTYSTLEHQWDEGFGYFGAARNYDEYTDDELAAKGGRPEFASGYQDFNGDNAIDLTSEFNFAASVNAAKRDRGSADSAKTDFTKQAFDAFLAGRALINANAGTELSTEQLDELRGYRDTAVLAWEKAIAATAVHYINDTLQDMGKFDTEDYSFLDHAKHWSELKGFALSLQFNPRNSLTDEQFAEVHTLIGDAPVLPTAEAGDIAQYRADLLAARAIFGTAYEFDAANLGDENGENGW